MIMDIRKDKRTGWRLDAGAGMTLWLAFLLILLFSGCCKKETAYIPAADSDLRMAAMLAITGGGASTGQSSKVSLEIARKDIENYLLKLGVNKKVSLQVVDTGTDTAEALKQLRNLYDQGFRLVVGPYSSAEVAALKPFADTQGMLLVSPSSVAVSLAIPGDNVFRFVSTDVIQGEAMTKMLKEDEIGAIVPIVRDDIWGRDLLEAVRKDFTASGGVVHDPVLYAPVGTDYQAMLAALEANVQYEVDRFGAGRVAVYLISLSEGAGFLARAGAFTAMNGVAWYGSSGFSQNGAAIADTNAARFAYTHGFSCPIYGLDEAARNKWQPLVSAITAEIGRVPDVYAVTAYDALWVTAMTLLKTGPSPTLPFIRTTFITEADNYFGASGPTYLDDNGDRATGNYDFWSVTRDASGFRWHRTATYNSSTGVIIRL